MIMRTRFSILLLLFAAVGFCQQPVQILTKQGSSNVPVAYDTLRDKPTDLYKIVSRAKAITSAVAPTSFSFNEIGSFNIATSLLDEESIINRKNWNSTDTRDLAFGGSATDSRVQQNRLVIPATNAITYTNIAITAPPIIPSSATAQAVDEMPYGGTQSVIAGGFTSGDGLNITKTQIGYNYNKIARTLTIDQRKDSGLTTLATLNNCFIAEPFTIGIAISNKTIAVVVGENGAIPKPILLFSRTDNANALDLRNPSVLAELKNCFTVVSSGSNVGSKFVLGELKAGYLQGVGIANPAQVLYDDGTPYKLGEDYVLHCSIAHFCKYDGPEDVNEAIETSTLAYVTYNPYTLKVRVLSRMCTLRGGVLYGENSGCTVISKTDGTALAIDPTWGSFSTGQVQNILYRLPGLPRGIQVLKNGTTMVLDNNTVSHYDPSLIKVGNLWYLCSDKTGQLTNNGSWGPQGYFPALYSSPDLTTWTLVNQYNGSTESEGGKITVQGGTRYVYSSEHSTMNVLSFPGMAKIGSFTIPPQFAAQTLSAHPCILQIIEGNETFYDFILFDNTAFNGNIFSWGLFRFLRANQRQTGHDYDNLKAIN